MGEAAYQRLRADIMACRLPPGRRLTERGLSAELGVGVSPIREALTRLDHEGLVLTLPRKGYQVAPLTVRAVDDLFDFWELLGPEIARRGFANGTAEQIKLVQDGFVAMQAMISQGEVNADTAEDFISLVASTFRYLALATGNSYLVSLMEKLILDLTRVYMLIIGSNSVSRNVLLSQIDFGALSLSGDGERFAQDMRQFIRNSHSEVLRILVRWPSVMAAQVVAH